MVVPSFANSSAFSFPQIPVWAARIPCKAFYISISILSLTGDIYILLLHHLI